MSIVDYIKALPKVELHAHLNGSASRGTLDGLIDQHVGRVPEEKIQEWKSKNISHAKTLTECFDLFRVIHEVVDCKNAIRQVTLDVVSEFAADNVHYLELRTTPRALTDLSMEDYVRTVLDALEEASIVNPSITTRLLLAIDRGRHSAEDAMRVVDLADNFRKHENGHRIVGVDLSGNPMAGDATIYLPALKEAQKRRLKLALHMAEVAGQNAESNALIALAPRVGHGTFLLPHRGGDESVVELILKHKIPIEACLTSNVALDTVSKYSDHQFGFWYKLNHPCIICTDDKGVFSTTLSDEYEHAQEAFNLSKEDLYQISYNAIGHIFESEEVKEKLRNTWKAWKHEHDTKSAKQ